MKFGSEVRKKMKELVKKSFLLGLGAASLTKSQAEKIVKELVKKNAVSIMESKAMLKRMAAQANKERLRVQNFAQKEAKRLAKDLSVRSKSQLGKVKKGLKSIDRELTARGRKSLKKNHEENLTCHLQ